MTSKTRRTEIQLETHEVKIIRFRPTLLSAYCWRCGSIVTAVTPEQAAELLQRTLADIYCSVNEGRLHIAGTARGLPLICGNSVTGEAETRY